MNASFTELSFSTDSFGQETKLKETIKCVFENIGTGCWTVASPVFNRHVAPILFQPLSAKRQLSDLIQNYTFTWSLQLWRGVPCSWSALNNSDRNANKCHINRRWS